MKSVCFVSMIVTNDSVWTGSAKNVLTFTLQIGIDGAYKNCSFSTSLPSKKKKKKIRVTIKRINHSGLCRPNKNRSTLSTTGRTAS